MSDWTDFDVKTISEFRSNHGKVGGWFEGAPILILHTKGGRTGKSHIKPVMYLRDGERYVVFASKGGAPRNPDWYHNLKAHPDIQIEVGDDTMEVRAEEMLGVEHDRLYNIQSTRYPQFADYQRKTKRIIPVVVLTKR
ncbi:MAG TPA: nitroreductase family deazaflavin-dependent oxidoreductase [Nitrososphaerales archaeon]|nr:nitroreductase family deazaflavin-dependent oxidoreductase [Nitrososphaerales archaeon]